MNILNLNSINKELTVEASQETAFKVFTEKMDRWWPRTHHTGKTPMTELVLEPGVNGRWYSRHEDGSEANVGHVLTWNPYELLVLNWQLGSNFQYNPDLVTEVEVQFIPAGPSTTKIKFTHKNLDRLGDDKTVERMGTGWGYIMQLYKNSTES